MAPLDKRQHKKKKLTVEQRGPHRMATGKTVARPVHKRPFHKGALPMHNDLYPLVQQHATGDGNEQCHEGWPPTLPNEKQNQQEHSDSYRVTRAELSQRVQHPRECRSKSLMKPRGNSLIGALKRIRQTQYRRGDLVVKNDVYHRKTEEV